ncbi:TPA: hypothetical protein ACH3X3_008354 [Trebouxia sp. C0006]
MITRMLNKLADTQGLLLPNVDDQDPSIERAQIELCAEVELKSKPPQAVEYSDSLPWAPRKLPDTQAQIFIDDTDGISDSQRIVGQRLLDRILILTQTSVPFAAGDDKEAWRKKSCDQLAQKFPDGLDFRILTPRFNTLEQQTMQRDADVPKVIQYNHSQTHWKQWVSFWEEVLKCPKRLFITIADECHWGPKAFQAYDKMVNDYAEGQAAGSSGSVQDGLLQQENYFVLLVSATPYNVISRASLIPEEYMVIATPNTPGLQQHDILHQRDRLGSWSLAVPTADSDDTVSMDIDESTEFTAEDLLKLTANGTVEEVHIVDWFPKHQVPNTGGYRRLDAYLESTLLQMGREGVCTSGIVQKCLKTGVVQLQEMGQIMQM